MPTEFVHLHVHSHFSFLHAVGSPAEHVAEAARGGMGALALTDHLGLWGAVEFHRAAGAAGIRPILGCEVRVRGLGRAGGGGTGRGFHLVLLARDRRGYENLVGLVRRAWLRAARDGRTARVPGTGPVPVLEDEDLAGRTAGLFALAPALDGEPGRLLLEGDGEAAEGAAAAAAAAGRDLFGRDGFLLEVSNRGLEAERRVNRGLARLAQDLGLRLVAGNDVHFPREGGAPSWALARAVGSGRAPQPYLSPCRAPLSPELWLKPPEAMAAALSEFPRAVAATVEVAEACGPSLPLGELHLPPSPVPGDPDAALRRLALDGLRARAGTEPEAEHLDRLERELRVIAARRLSGCFLVVRDLCRHAREQGIPVGPGRGSAAGSLVGYALGITGVDPVRHGLLFERFLDPDRARLPDIDLDVCPLGREALIEYLYRRHGPERVCRVGAVARFGPRGALRAAAAALGVDPRLADRLARLLPERTDAGLAGALAAWPEFRALPLDEEPFRALVAAATHLEGAPRHPALHPAGIVLGGPELERLLPVQVAASGEPVSQYDLQGVEALGFVKFDLLGLRNLTIVDDALRAAARDGALPAADPDAAPRKKNPDAAPDPAPPAPAAAAPSPERIPLDDADAFRLLRRGDTVGCFQLESAGIRRLLRAFAPRDLDDLTLLLALYRPGPWDAGAVAALLRRRRGEAPPAAPHPLLEPILAETGGVLLYQEQVMRIAAVVAGLPLGAADGLRRALERAGRAGPAAEGGEGEGALAAWRRRFVAGARARGIAEDAAADLFAFLERFAGYSFCKAHATPYALVSYWTAYLKAHCPAHYFAALLTLGAGYHAPWVYVAEARRAGAPLLPPDVNRSTAGFRAERRDAAGDDRSHAPGAPPPAGGWAVRPGLLAARGIGVHLARRLLEERLAHGPFRSLADLDARLRRAGDGFGRAALPRALEGLVAAGFLDALGERRDLPPLRRRELEEASLGWSWSTPLLAPFRDALPRLGVIPSPRLAGLPSGSRVAVAGRVATARRQRTRRGAPLLFLVLHDGEGMIEVTVPPERYLRLFRRIDPAGVLVRGRLAAGAAETGRDGGPPPVVAEEIQPLAEAVLPADDGRAAKRSP